MRYVGKIKPPAPELLADLKAKYKHQRYNKAVKIRFGMFTDSWYWEQAIIDLRRNINMTSDKFWEYVRWYERKYGTKNIIINPDLVKEWEKEKKL